jgi:hypothetical protein
MGDLSMGWSAGDNKRIRRVARGAVVAVLFLAGCGEAEPETPGTPAAMRRLTQAQYKNVIADVFGPDIRVSGRLDPDVRKDGLFEIGATEATFTPGSLEQYDQLARGIAAEVLDERRRATMMPCEPKTEAAPDPACAREFLALTGRLLFRRPMTEDEIADRVALAGRSAEKMGNFYDGLEYGLASLLVAPQFLFRKDTVVAHDGQFRLDGYAKASRLSFLLWNAGPDEALLTAAETGELDSGRGLARQVDRMLASPRIEAGVRAFFDDYLQFSLFESLDKDPVIYPKFSQTVALDAREQTLRTVVHHLIADDGDYRDLFTTRKTFMSRALGVVYQVPVPPQEAWSPYEFAPNDPRAGLLTQLSFTALYSPPGRSSPTLRGKAIREVFLCQTVPVPPVNVDFTSFESARDKPSTTVRDRLTDHRENPVCAGCHALIDPMGLALENFDGLGVYRTMENGAPIDASGELDRVKFTDVRGLAQTMHDNPRTASCFVSRVFAYGVGRKPAAGDNALLAFLGEKFAAEGYKLKPLLRRIATSEAFYRIAPPAPTEDSVLSKEKA